MKTSFCRKNLSSKEIISILESDYDGLKTLKYFQRYSNGDNRKKMINWVIGNFSTSYDIARRLVIHANSLDI